MIRGGCVLPNDFSNLNRSQRQALIEKKLEKNAHRRLVELQNRHPQAHFLDRHGAHLDLQSQMDRAKYGIDPTTGLVGRHLPPSATRFFSHRDQLNAINRAEQIFKNTGSKSLSERPIGFGHIIGSGYGRNGAPYSVHNSAIVRVDQSTGLAITAFPK